MRERERTRLKHTHVLVIPPSQRPVRAEDGLGDVPVRSDRNGGPDAAEEAVVREATERPDLLGQEAGRGVQVVLVEVGGRRCRRGQRPRSERLGRYLFTISSKLLKPGQARKDVASRGGEL